MRPDSDIHGAVRAFAQGREKLLAGEFDYARGWFREAVKLAPAGSTIREQAQEHMDFRLPVARAQRWLLAGRAAKAEQVLRAAVTQNEGHPDRQAQLETMLENLAPVPDAAPQPLGYDNQALLDGVRAKLEQFRLEHRRYPVSFNELNALLPADRAPLEQFDVIRFESNGAGYLLVLRNKRDARHTITLQKTGFLR